MDGLHRSELDRFLRRLLLHSTLTEEEQQAILNLPGETVRAPARRDLVRPGETVDHAILVVEGTLARFDLMANGSRQITALYIPGDMCDLYSVVAPQTGWGIAALGTSTVLNVPHRDLRALAADHANMAFAFWRDTTLDASILSKWVANIGRKNSRARLAHLLCEMMIRMEQVGLCQRQTYMLDLTQEQMADAVGLTPVHVNRTLQALRNEGLISLKGRQVEILAWDRLAAEAEFEPAFLLPRVKEDDRCL